MLRDYYKKVKTVYGYTRDRQFLSKVIDIMEDKWDRRNIFIIEAPTGYGKTTITATLSLRAYEEGNKLIIALPLRTLLEDQFNKLRKIVSDNKALGKRYMHERTSPYLIKPITLTTIDTLSLTMFGIAPEDLNKVIRSWDEWTGTIQSTAGHYIFSWSSVILSDIILDEVHLLIDETNSLTYLIALIKHMIKNQQHVILMSATIPSILERAIRRYLASYANRIEFIKFQYEDNDNYILDKLKKTYELKITHLNLDDKYNTILNWIKEGMLNGLKRVLVIFNTVNDAIRFYDMLDYENKLLMHSRFSPEDRQRKYERLQDFNKKDEYIIVGTQTIEAGIDISSTLLITELAPLNSLIQRFGRFLRYEEKFGKAYIWYDNTLSNQNSGNYKVYQKNLCMKTLDLLRQNLNVNMHVPYGENGYKTLINELYESHIKLPTENQIDNMLSIFLDFDKISNAIELFFSLEGSFVRSSFIIPVKTQDNQSPIPINYHIFRRLLRNGKVRYIASQDGDKRTLDDESRKILTYEKNVIKYLYKMNVESFIIDAAYSPEYGLKLGDEYYD